MSKEPKGEVVGYIFPHRREGMTINVKEGKGEGKEGVKGSMVLFSGSSSAL